jgi:hypothetical protein
MPLTTTALRAPSSANVNVERAITVGSEGPLSLIVVSLPALTETGETVVSLPEVRTTPSTAPTVVVPSASTRTWKAVPSTVFVEVGVVTV